MEPMEVLKLSDMKTFFSKAHDSNCITPVYSVTRMLIPDSLSIYADCRLH